MTASHKVHCTTMPLDSADRILCIAEVPVHNHRVIYDLMDTVRGIMEGRLSPVEQVTEIGSAEVRAVFGSGSRKIAGCMVNEGSLKKGCTVEVGLTAPLHLAVSMWLPKDLQCSIPLSTSHIALLVASELITLFTPHIVHLLLVAAHQAVCSLLDVLRL